MGVVEREVETFVPLNFRSEMTENDLVLMHMQYQILPKYPLEVLGLGDRICAPLEGQLGLYKESFRADL